MTVRLAEVHDARAIAEVHVRSWQRGYRGHLPDDYLDALRPEDRQVVWKRNLSTIDPVNKRTTLVAERDDRIVGFASIGKSEGEPDVGELYAIYVDPSHWGQRVGIELLEAAEGQLASEGFRKALLWVLPANQPARAFYEDLGWSTDGTERTAEVWDLRLPEILYKKSLATRS